MKISSSKDEFPKISVGCNWSVLLTIAIVLIRAFQTNAEPMSNWSAKSWIWMTCPIWIASAIGIVFFVVFFALWIWANYKNY